MRKGRLATGARHGLNLHPDRRSPGERNGYAKLTWGLVDRLRADAKAGIPTRVLAQRFGVVPHTVRDVVAGKYWKEEHHP